MAKKMLLRDYIGRQITLNLKLETVGGQCFEAGQRMKVVSTHRGRFEAWAVPYRRENGGMVGIRRLLPHEISLIPTDQEIATGTA